MTHSPDPQSPLTVDEKFIIALNKVSTMAYLGGCIFVGWVTDHWTAQFFAIACLGIISLGEIFMLLWKQTGIDGLLHTATGLALLSWLLGLIAGVCLL